MTTVRFQRQGKNIRSVEVTDHAGYGQAGEDIVCSAVSSSLMLTDTLLEDVWGIPVHQEIQEEPPRICLVMPEDGDARAQDALVALQMHFKSLKEEYPDFIEVLEV